MYGIGYAAHDGVVDSVPDSCEDEHDHDEQRTQMEHVGVELLKQRGYQSKGETPCGQGYRRLQSHP